MVMLGGCDSMIPRYHQTRTMSVDHVAGSALSIETGNGSVSAIAGETDVVSISIDLFGPNQERLDEASVHWDRDQDQTLVLWVQWPGDRRRSNEGASWDIMLPDASGADIHSSNGSITIDGFSGHAELKSSNGKINVRRHDGSVHAGTSNGAINIEHISGELDLNTSNGRITVLDAFGPILAETSNGKVYVSTMDGNEGPIRVRTSNGSVDLDLGEGFVGLLKCQTGNGGIEIHDLDGASLIESSKHRLEMQFGDSNAVSAVRTSNGSIRVRRRMGEPIVP